MPERVTATVRVKVGLGEALKVNPKILARGLSLLSAPTSLLQHPSPANTQTEGVGYPGIRYTPPGSLGCRVWEGWGSVLWVEVVGFRA